mmetsp:Transcript_24934/g.34646  ORF Transcript_24934/g.34646 Transcript_24934/m.34646 type:complete len:518 (-) Transcript_24934:7-1560(-)
METVEAPPGWKPHLTVAVRDVGEVEPPPGWKHSCSLTPSSSNPRKRKRRSSVCPTKWVAAGADYPPNCKLRVEELFELYQIIGIAKPEELASACRVKEMHERKRNPWRKVTEPLSRMQRLLSSKGKHSPSSSSEFLPVISYDSNSLRRTIRQLDGDSLTLLHNHLTKIPRIQENCISNIDPDNFLPVDLWVRVLSFLDFKSVWGTVSRVSRGWFQVTCSKKYWGSLTNIKLSHGFPAIRELSTFFMRLSDGLTHADFSAEMSSRSARSLIANDEWITQVHSKISDHVVRHLGACPRLQTLDLSKCERISDNGFLYIAGSCHQLRLLDLTDCTGITDRSLNQLAFGCPELDTIILKGCYNVTDLGLRALSTGCRKLETVILRRCRNITDNGVAPLAKCLSKLRSLDLYSCYRISDVSCKSLAENCSLLERLVLGGCRQITDRGVRLLSKGCRKLKKLDLFETKVTADGIVPATRNLALDSLNLFGTSVTKQALSQMNFPFESVKEFFIEMKRGDEATG